MAKPANRKPSQQGKNVGGQHLGFTLALDIVPGLPLAECRRIERFLEDHAELHGLVLSGHQLTPYVMAAEHELSAVDQVTLIDRLVDVPGLVSIRVGAIGRTRPTGDEDDLPENDTADAHVIARSGDLALIGLTLLYRCGRITAPLYLQILGGFVRQVGLH